jgi:plasmid stabilization system protein ParE
MGEYIILYCVEGPDVSILRVAHGRRDLENLFEQ